jgi:hypothetical protein
MNLLLIHFIVIFIFTSFSGTKAGRSTPSTKSDTFWGMSGSLYSGQKGDRGSNLVACMVYSDG